MREDASGRLDDLRRVPATLLGAHLARLLDARDVSDQEIEKDFREHRRGR